MNDDPNPITPAEAPELAALLREIRDRLPPTPPASRWQPLQDAVRMVEPWGVLIGVAALLFTAVVFQVEQTAREEDRINRAIGQFADGIGRIDALGVLLRNNVDLRALKAPGAFIPNASLSGAILVHANFSGAELDAADLSGVDLGAADLSGAALFNANLSGANLGYANLSRAYLGGANLSDATLLKANLSGTFLLNANLSDAFLIHVNLSRADLSGADLSGVDLSVAHLCQTTMPDESRCDRDCDPSGACSWPGQVDPRIATPQ